jgi:hypothetical protein
MTLEELALRLRELVEARKTVEVEVAALNRSEERAKELEKDRDAPC